MYSFLFFSTFKVRGWWYLLMYKSICAYKSRTDKGFLLVDTRQNMIHSGPFLCHQM